jgi:hypothetical protein
MSTEGERYRATYRFGALERRGLVGASRPGRVVLLGAACLVAVVVFRRWPTTGGLGIAMLLVGAACLATWLPVAGRTLDEWVPVVAGWLAARALGASRFRSAVPRAGTTLALESRERHRPLELPRPLDRVGLIGLPLADDRELGVFADRRDGTYTAVAAVRVRSFGLLAAADQERRLERWGRVLASLARDGSPVRRLQVTERTLPHDEDQLAQWLEARADRTLPADAPARRSYETLLGTAADVTQDHDVLLALQVDPRRARSTPWTERPQSRDEAGGQLALREMRAFAERLEAADAGVVGLLSNVQCAHAVRLAYEPHLRGEYSRLRLTEAHQLGPTAADALWDRYRSDGAVHRTYWIAQWPRLNVGPAFLAPLLLSATAVRAFSVVVEPVSPARARFAVEAAVTSDEADEQLRRERGFRTSARRRKQQAATRQRESELAEGHEELRFAGFITVSARNDAELERSCQEVADAAQQAYLDLQPMWGQQDVGFVCGALPLCHGLARAGLLDR